MFSLFFGDGSAGRALPRPPADFRDLIAAGSTDEQLYEWIAGGVPGTAMPPFEGVLSRQQILDVVSYIRTLAEPES